jgi:magnesium-transporting ATPase (P-type)
MGDTVPADLRLFEAMNLAADEQSLTGESMAVEKVVDRLEDIELGIGDRINIAYGTTTVQKGRGRGVVICTGMDTEVGKIAAVSDSDSNNSFHRRYRKCRWLSHLSDLSQADPVISSRPQGRGAKPAVQ